MLWLNILFFVLSCAILFGSGTYLVKSIGKISVFLRISEFTAAFIIIAIATSLPELFVGISSALTQNTALSLGNVIGANIANFALIGGIMILLARGIKIKKKDIKKSSLFLIPIVILPLVLFFIDGSLNWIDGIILIAAFCLYSWRILKRRKKFKKPLENETRIKREKVILYSIIFVISLIFLFASSYFVVKYATVLSLELMLPPIIIGLFLIAIGTTLPELAFGARAAQLGYGEMALGDLFGSVVVNSTLVLGITALIFPITANLMLVLVSAIFLILLTFLFATFLHSGSKLYVMEGIALLLLYIFFIFIQFYLGFV
ncbi:MAG: sodium:calcium antiporter [Candidatus Pacearchaeota archaeon]|nr:MAG: sodium:calcium antiporter [Candidatus Pacearchaeota archaeon]